MRSKGSSHRSANDEFLDFTASIDFDRRLWRHDVAGSIAHAHTLTSAGVLNKSECIALVEALKDIAKVLARDQTILEKKHEDIHMNIEKMLVDRTGETGKKLHTGRSRNDQVALDMRLFGPGRTASPPGLRRQAGRQGRGGTAASCFSRRAVNQTVEPWLGVPSFGSPRPVTSRPWG